MGGAGVQGSCLCGEVRYEINGPLSGIYYCHCSRCRKVTGAAHATNMLLQPDQIRWLAGEALIGRYAHAGAERFASAFCTRCVSHLVVPVGSLDEDPGQAPLRNVWWGSRAPWYVSANELETFEQRPG